MMSSLRLIVHEELILNLFLDRIFVVSRSREYEGAVSDRHREIVLPTSASQLNNRNNLIISVQQKNLIQDYII